MIPQPIADRLNWELSAGRGSPSRPSGIREAFTMTTIHVHMGHVHNTIWQRYIGKVCLYLHVGVMGSTCMTMDDDSDRHYVQLGMCNIKRLHKISKELFLLEPQATWKLKV